MQIGALDRTVTLLTATTSRNEVGEEIVGTTTLADVAAQKLFLSLKDVQKAGLHTTPVDAKFRIRWRGDLTIRDRVQHDGVTYDIVAIDEEHRRRSLILTLRAG